MDKRKRNYILLVETVEHDTLEIKLPFTIEFDVNRNDLSSTNVASIRVYNLSLKNRNKIRKDQFDGDELRRVTLFAGYGSDLAKVLDGNITQAWSVREGNNFITQMECFDAGYASQNAKTNKTYVEGTPNKTVITDLVQSLKPFGVNVGNIGDFPGALPKSSSLSGNTFDIIRDLTGGQFFVDNGMAHCMADDECIAGDVLEISSASGLLGTPVRETQFFRFDMIFEPKLFLFQQVFMNSSTGVNFNGICKIVGLQHKVTISESVSGNAVTSVKLLGAGGFKQVRAS